jgi:type I restriction enzyme S subunit
MNVFPKYERYRASGVEWLGQIPEHWSVSKTRWLWREVEDPSDNGDEQLLSISQYTGVTPTNAESRSESLVGYRRCKPNDLAMNIMLAWQGGLGVTDHEGIVSPAYSVFRLRGDNNAHYFSYLYRTKHYLDEFGRNSTGIVPSRWRLYPDKFGHIQTLLPPKPEQDRIVAFLDRKTAEIDALIAKKQRQIELLDEHKAILINRAVTRGLNPNAKLKPSGIEWIGEIPEHWEVLKLRRLLSNIEQGNSPNAVQENGDPNQWKVITLSAVSRGVFRNDAYKPISSTTAQKEANTLAPGDLLLTRANTRSLVGDACIVESVLPNTTFSDLVYRFQLNSRANSKYLLRYLLSNASRSQIERDARGSNETMCKVSHGHIKEWDVALPPMKEQLAIVSHLERLDQTREGTIGSLKSQIQSLKTLRSSLIAHAVTGRIKV